METKKKGGCLKGCLFTFIGFLILMGLLGACFGGEEDSSSSKKDEVAVTEAKEKKEDSTKPKEKEVVKDTVTDEEKLEQEKKYYLENVKPKIETQMGMFDSAWDELWKPTFEGIGTTVDVYTAYDNMKQLEQRYDTLYSSLPEIKGEKLSKENKKLLKEFTDGMRDASMWRGEAAEKAQKMFDSGDYSPSKMDDMKTDIAYADSTMMDAILAYTKLEISLGVIEE